MAALLILNLLITHTMANNQADTNSEETSQRGTALLAHAYRSFYSDSYPSCLMACIDDSQCMSFNFWRNASVCDLNNKSKYSAGPKFLSEDVQSTYMGLMRETGKLHAFLCFLFRSAARKRGSINNRVTFFLSLKILHRTPNNLSTEIM